MKEICEFEFCLQGENSKLATKNIYEFLLKQGYLAKITLESPTRQLTMKKEVL